MAKQPSLLGGRSKVRMFYVDAELASGEMQQLTEALRNAIRPTHIITRPATPLQIAENGKATNESEVEISETVDVDAPDTDVVLEEQAPKSSKPRKYRSPKVVNELDMKSGGKSFAEFAAEKGNPTGQNMRYLVGSYWLAEFAGVSESSTDHIYTCYKSADWVFDVTDPGLPFRQLKRDGYGDTTAGKFKINHIGRSKVEKMQSHLTSEG